MSNSEWNPSQYKRVTLPGWSETTQDLFFLWQFLLDANRVNFLHTFWGELKKNRGLGKARRGGADTTRRSFCSEHSARLDRGCGSLRETSRIIYCLAADEFALPPPYSPSPLGSLEDDPHPLVSLPLDPGIGGGPACLPRTRWVKRSSCVRFGAIEYEMHRCTNKGSISPTVLFTHDQWFQV